jgi:hypothetical protein
MNKEQVEKIRKSYEEKVKMGGELFNNSLVSHTACINLTDKSLKKLEEKQIQQPLGQLNKRILNVPR